jgi:hypothetical protein
MHTLCWVSAETQRKSLFMAKNPRCWIFVSRVTSAKNLKRFTAHYSFRLKHAARNDILNRKLQCVPGLSSKYMDSWIYKNNVNKPLAFWNQASGVNSAHGWPCFPGLTFNGAIKDAASSPNINTSSGGNSFFPVRGAKPSKFPTKLSNFRHTPPHLHLKRLFLALF